MSALTTSSSPARIARKTSAAFACVTSIVSVGASATDLLLAERHGMPPTLDAARPSGDPESHAQIVTPRHE
jgi:hypothetical protein